STKSSRKNPRCPFLSANRSESNDSGKKAEKLPSADSVRHKCFHAITTLVLDIQHDRVGITFIRGLSHRYIGRSRGGLQHPSFGALRQLLMQQIEKHRSIRRHILLHDGLHLHLAILIHREAERPEL